MKRGPALAPLSREHHIALVVAQQLSKAGPDDAAAAAARFVATTDDLLEAGARLRAHVQMEERELFPYLEQTLEPAALEEIGARLEQERP